VKGGWHETRVLVVCGAIWRAAAILPYTITHQRGHQRGQNMMTRALCCDDLAVVAGFREREKRGDLTGACVVAAPLSLSPDSLHTFVMLPLSLTFLRSERRAVALWS